MEKPVSGTALGGKKIDCGLGDDAGGIGGGICRAAGRGAS
jgi:hypothetical protein